MRQSFLQGPCCHDGLSAKLIEDAEFPLAFMSGFGVSAARLGAPDTNLLSYSEVLDQGRWNFFSYFVSVPLQLKTDSHFSHNSHTLT